MFIVDIFMFLGRAKFSVTEVIWHMDSILSVFH